MEDNVDIDDEDDDECELGEVEEKKITPFEVIQALKVVSQWSDQNYVDVTDIVALKHIEEKAVLASLASKKVQTKITSYFKQ